jgi:hypothetical protein
MDLWYLEVGSLGVRVSVRSVQSVFLVFRLKLMDEELKGGYGTTPVFWAAGKGDDVVTPASTY